MRLPLIVSCWVPLWPRAQGLTSIISRSDSNCGRILGPWRLFESYLISRCSIDGLQVGGCNIWPRAPRPDFNNCSWDNLNSGHILASGVYSSLTQIMAPSQAITILGQMKICLLRCPAYDLQMGACNIWPRARLDFNNGPRDNSNSGRTSAPVVYSSPIRIMAPFQAILILEC